MMKAMILAAGRGERMKPLTDHCPKPLLKVQGKPLIEYHLEKLAAIGITDVVINHAWLGNMLVEYLGSGEKWHINIHYSDESSGALETAGGIKKALNVLATDGSDLPFLVINGDVLIDFDFTRLPTLTADLKAHLWLVNNPTHHPDGDFGMDNDLLINHADKKLTFSGIALYRPSFFNNVGDERCEKLAPLLRDGADKSIISASVLSGRWVDVGTPERLALLNEGK